MTRQVLMTKVVGCGVGKMTMRIAYAVVINGVSASTVTQESMLPDNGDWISASQQLHDEWSAKILAESNQYIDHESEA